MAKSSQVQKRQDARKAKIMDIVWRTPRASRTLIQKTTHMSMESTLTLVNELLEEGLLLRAGKSDGNSVGRKSMILRINPDGCYGMGIRFNARCITGVVINLEHKPVLTERMLVPGDTDTAEILEMLKACVHRLLDGLKERSGRLEGIGIASPGVMDLSNEMVKRYVHVPDWHDVPLREWMQKEFPWPVSLEHDVKCTARALRMQPKYRHAKNMLLVQMDRGVYMCMILNGHIYHGSTNISGEIGHVCAVEGGWPCACGQAGCLETVASDSAFLEQIRQGMARGGFQKLRALAGKERDITIADLVRSSELGDDEASALLSVAGTALAKVLASAITLLNPDHLIVSGILATTPAFQSAFLRTVEGRTLREGLEAVMISFETYDDLINAAGAAELTLSRRFSVREVL
jgi:N-acetylglucosamine repressor